MSLNGYIDVQNGGSLKLVAFDEDNVAQITCSLYDVTAGEDRGLGYNIQGKVIFSTAATVAFNYATHSFDGYGPYLNEAGDLVECMEEFDPFT